MDVHKYVKQGMCKVHLVKPVILSEAKNPEFFDSKTVGLGRILDPSLHSE